jgi:hypothetical protein
MNRPMQKIYLVIRSALVFFFVISLIDEGLAITGRTGGKIVLSLVFGALMLLIPYILGFFKITINFWSSMLMGILIALVYILIMYLGIGQLLYFTEAAVLDLGLGENYRLCYGQANIASSDTCVVCRWEYSLGQVIRKLACAILLPTTDHC